MNRARWRSHPGDIARVRGSPPSGHGRVRAARPDRASRAIPACPWGAKRGVCWWCPRPVRDREYGCGVLPINCARIESRYAGNKCDLDFWTAVMSARHAWHHRPARCRSVSHTSGVKTQSAWRRIRTEAVASSRRSLA